jgi:glycine cleavage system H protein
LDTDGETPGSREAISQVPKTGGRRWDFIAFLLFFFGDALNFADGRAARPAALKHPTRGCLMQFPEDLLYTESHEWVRKEGGPVVTVGLTEYAQSQLKDIVFVELPQVGAEFRKGDALAVVESVKTVADVYSPLAGKVVEVNLSLKDHPQFLNEDPFGKGWIAKMALTRPEELEALLSAQVYRSGLPEE